MSYNIPSVYLAGPAVFRHDVVHIAQCWKIECKKVGIEGRFPLDLDVDLSDKDGPEQARLIFEANVSLIKRCHGVIAELTPFRGPSADVGTAFEVGFAVALGLPVIAWSEDTRTYADRLRTLNRDLQADKNGLVDAHDLTRVENFELTDNLMISVPLYDRTVHNSFPKAAHAMAAVLLA